MLHALFGNIIGLFNKMVEDLLRIEESNRIPSSMKRVIYTYEYALLPLVYGI